jgi:SRSO17 transposase
VENCQVGVFVAYASRFGQALVDRRLYLPEAWASDAARRQSATVPETVTFQTKSAIAAEMIGAALDAGEGTKGPRRYEWVRIALPWTVDTGFERWLLIRRSRRDVSERAYCLVFTHSGTTLAELAGAAGLRWTIEACFQRAKEELGLDHCEARSWHGWHRHMTLCMAAAAFLARLQAALRRAAFDKPNRTSPPLAA